VSQPIIAQPSTPAGRIRNNWPAIPWLFDLMDVHLCTMTMGAPAR
jgi:hypothetical protein